MTSKQELVQELVERFNGHDAAAFAAAYAPDATVHDPQHGEPLRGRDAIERDIADFFTSFPDIQNTVQVTLESDDVIATRSTMTATHGGPLAGPEGEIPPTGQPVRIEVAVFSRVNEDGQVTEEHRYYDLAGLVEQLAVKS